MKKLLLALLVLGFTNSPVSAGDQHRETKECSCLLCLCQDCKCEASPKKQHRTGAIPSKGYLDLVQKHKKYPCDCSTKVEKPRISYQKRVWVEDVYQPGLWYYGYYVAVNSNWEFHYSRKEYKGALSNFRSLYPVQYKYDVKTSGRQAVRTVYEPAY